jgi:hypothetical protein
MKRMFAFEGPNGAASVEIRAHPVSGDVKLVENQLNIHEEPGPKQFLHRISDFVLQSKPTTPEEEIERTVKIFQAFQTPKPEMTVGDLTLKQDCKTRAKEAKRYLRTIKEDLTIGDLSAVTDEKPDNPRLDNIFIGRRLTQPAISESQQLNVEHIRKHKEKMAEQLRLRSLVIDGKDEKLMEYAAQYLKDKPEKEPEEKA